VPHECLRNHLALERIVQELEFIIHADGRVEERVRGIKGVDCQSVTAEINKALGEVIQSKPTQEMFEQKVTALNRPHLTCLPHLTGTVAHRQVELSVGVENTVSETWGNGGSSGSSKEW
jgi:hypothetical protein